MLLIRTQKAKESFGDNQFHDILRLFYVFPNFTLTTRETMSDYYLSTWYVRVASRVSERFQTEDLRKLRHLTKVSKVDRMVA